MGVQGTYGVGGASQRRPSHVAYYVALAAILVLLMLLLLYFFYFFINKIRKFNSSECVTEVAPRRPPPAAYPVQPEVREGASEMAKLCKQLPPPGKGGTVFPKSTSPAAVRTDTGERTPNPGTPTVPNTPSIVIPPSTDPSLVKSASAVPAVVVESIITQ